MSRKVKFRQVFDHTIVFDHIEHVVNILITKHLFNGYICLIRICQIGVSLMIGKPTCFNFLMNTFQIYRVFTTSFKPFHQFKQHKGDNTLSVWRTLINIIAFIFR